MAWRPMDPVFPSKRDAWIVAVVRLSIAALFAGAGVTLGSSGPLAARVALAGFLLLSGAFSLAVIYGTAYTVTATEIRVRGGPLRWRIPLAAIVRLVPRA